MLSIISTILNSTTTLPLFKQLAFAAAPAIDEDYLSRGLCENMLGGDLDNNKTSTEYAIHENLPMTSTGCDAHESSSKGCKMTFESLPSKILLKIVTKLPYDGQGLTHITNLRNACTRVDELSKKHERFLAKAISAEQFPAASFLLMPFLCDFAGLHLVGSCYEQLQCACIVAHDESSQINLSGMTRRSAGWAYTIKGWEKFFEIGYHVLKWIHIVSSSCKTAFTLTVAPDLLPKELLLLVRFTTLIMFDNLKLTPELDVPHDIALIEGVIPSIAYEQALETMLFQVDFDMFVQAVHKRNPHYLNQAEKCLQNCVQKAAEHYEVTHVAVARQLLLYVHNNISNGIYDNYGIEGDLERSYKFRISKLGAVLQKTIGDKTVCSALKDLELLNKTRELLKVEREQDEAKGSRS